MKADEFAQLVLSKVAPDAIHYPIVAYDAARDCLEFLATNESFYAVPTDGPVTVYYGEESNQIVGCEVRNVKSLLRETLAKSPGFRSEIQAGRLKLEHFFTACLWSTPIDRQSERAGTLMQLREVAEQSQAVAELDGLLAA